MADFRMSEDGSITDVPSEEVPEMVPAEEVEIVEDKPDNADNKAAANRFRWVRLFWTCSAPRKLRGQSILAEQVQNQS